MNWISVKDRLPPKDTRVLVYCNDEEDEDTQCSSGSGIHTAYIHTQLTQFSESLPNCGCTGLNGIVTHWMPLPERPNGMD
jgi:hypothetical protein